MTLPDPPKEVSDREVLSMMLGFGIQGADAAAEKWCSGKYTSHLDGPEAHAQIRENYYKYESAKRRMREIVRFLESSLKMVEISR